MIKLPKAQTQALLTVHGWSGVLLGLLLYAVICTGVAAVFAKEISDWSSPLARPAPTTAAPGFDAAFRSLAAQVEPRFLDDVVFFPTAGGRWNLLFHTDEKLPSGETTERGTEFELDGATWQPLARRDGLVKEIAEQRRSGAVADFLVDLHVRLHLPNPWGLLLTGTLGLMMMVAAVSGLFLHRHLFKELFTLRRRGALLTARDVHVVAGTWNLPFAFLLAFTGSFFSFATTVGVPVMAMVAFEGDVEAATAALTAKKLPENSVPATPPNLDPILADARRRAGGGEVGFLQIEHWGRADGHASIQLAAAEGGLIGDIYLYSLAGDGGFLREQPFLGHAPSLGNDLVMLMSPLHFGNFAGVWSKSAWFALGFAGAYVTLTGMLLWTRRREEQRAWRRMARAVYAVGYGLPLCLALAPYAFFLLRERAWHPLDTQGVLFLAVAALVIAYAVLTRDLAAYRRRLLAATGVALVGLPLVRLASGGLGWAAAWQQGLVTLLSVELGLLVAGALCLRFAAKRPAAERALLPAPALAA